MMLDWAQRHGREQAGALSVEQRLELVRLEQEALEKRVRLIEDLIAALRREGVAGEGET